MVTAGLTTLKLIQQKGFYEAITTTTQSLITGLTNAAKQAGVPFSATSLGSMFGLFFRNDVPTTYAQMMECDKEKFGRFFHGMLREGVYLAPSAFEAGFVSAMHTQAEVDATVSAAAHVFSTL